MLFFRRSQESLLLLAWGFLIVINSRFVSHAFTVTPYSQATRWQPMRGFAHGNSLSDDSSSLVFTSLKKVSTRLAARNDETVDDDAVVESTYLSTPAGYFLGVCGTIAALVTFYSEFTLKTTGCGLPAGPFGLFGLVEGLSYLAVTGISAYSIVTKIKTGSGLPAGPFGLVGAAEGLSFLAIAVGLVVLALQVLDYGYVPNAVPMEGGMCS
ncbi:hypothetical protein IV203_004247 [Nitzschia inconspicua]|uniref:Uncharacterized protein n=1 Tax=Nitzschia inconspicua TaxID=303405 RepID=A0A9K3L4W3_9STRA|nr:hypothetical protein IV203_004247 [Nitzschia inconspicua]